MFEALGSAIKQEQEKLERTKEWLNEFVKLLTDKRLLMSPFREEELVYPVPTSVSSIMEVAGVDGGIVSEAMTGFDLALYRAVAAVFKGVGKKVEAKYVPHFDPDPQIFFSPSLPSRQEFNRICTLMRLYAEYEVAKMTIKQTKVSVIFLDGKVTPLSSDFTGTANSKLLKQAEKDVKMIYEELVQLALDNNVVLCGIVKDSRSREVTEKLGSVIPKLIRSEGWPREKVWKWPYILEDLQDSVFSDIVLDVNQRTAWVESSMPTWFNSKYAKVWTCMVRLLDDDEPLRVEAIVDPSREESRDGIEVALGSLSVLTNHGLPLAIPTVILEADERTKLSSDHLDHVIDQISMSLGVPRDQLRKRRYFSSSLSKL